MFYSLSCSWRESPVVCPILLTHQWLHIRSIYTNLIVWLLTVLHNLQVITQTITQEDCILPKNNAKWGRILQLFEQLIFCVTGKWTTGKSSLIFRFYNLKNAFLKLKQSSSMYWRLCYDDDKTTHERIMPSTLIINTPPSLETHSDKASHEGKNFCGKREICLSQKNMIWKTDLQSPWLAHITSFICILFFLNSPENLYSGERKMNIPLAAIAATLDMSRLLQNCYLTAIC